MILYKISLKPFLQLMKTKTYGNTVITIPEDGSLF